MENDSLKHLKTLLDNASSEYIGTQEEQKIYLSIRSGDASKVDEFLLSQNIYVLKKIRSRVDNSEIKDPEKVLKTCIDYFRELILSDLGRKENGRYYRFREWYLEEAITKVLKDS